MRAALCQPLVGGIFLWGALFGFEAHARLPILSLEEIQRQLPEFYSAVKQAELLGKARAFFDGWTQDEVRFLKNSLLALEKKSEQVRVANRPIPPLFISGYAWSLRGILNEVDTWVQFRDAYHGRFFRGLEIQTLGGLRLDSAFKVKLARPDGIAYAIDEEQGSLILVGLLEAKVNFDRGDAVSEHVLRFMKQHQSNAQREGAPICLPHAGNQRCFKPAQVLFLVPSADRFLLKPLKHAEITDILSIVQGAQVKERRSFDGREVSKYSIYSQWNSLELGRIISAYIELMLPNHGPKKLFRAHSYGSLGKALNKLNLYLYDEGSSTRNHLREKRSWEPTIELLVEWLKLQGGEKLKAFKLLIEFMEVTPLGLKRLGEIVGYKPASGETVEDARKLFGVERHRDFLVVSDSNQLKPMMIPGDEARVLNQCRSAFLKKGAE